MSLLRRPTPHPFRPPAFASELWRHRSLLRQFTLRSFELRHRGSYLGFVWSLLNPLLMLSLYVVVFGYIFNGSFRVLAHETKLDYALTIFLGLTIFQFLAEVLALAPSVVVFSPNLVKKVVFPLPVLPASVVGAAGLHLGISLVLALTGIAVLGPGLTTRALWLPLILLPMFPLGLGLAWLLGGLGVFLRDINHLVGFFTTVLMYASALFFPISIVPPAVWKFLRLNPILLTVDLARNATIWDHPLNLHHLAYTWIVAFATCLIGYGCFRRLSPAFADVL